MTTIQGSKSSPSLQGVSGSAIQSPYPAPNVASFLKPVNTILQDKTLYPWGNAYTWDFMPWNWGDADRTPDGPIEQAPSERKETAVVDNVLMFGVVIAAALIVLKKGKK